jgi:hypothetical protein
MSTTDDEARSMGFAIPLTAKASTGKIQVRAKCDRDDAPEALCVPPMRRGLDKAG